MEAGEAVRTRAQVEGRIHALEAALKLRDTPDIKAELESLRAILQHDLLADPVALAEGKEIAKGHLMAVVWVLE